MTLERKKGYILLKNLFQEMGITYQNKEELFKNSAIQVIKNMNSGIAFSYFYKGEKYYFKSNFFGRLYEIPIDPYSELVAEELAHDFKIPCVSYDLAQFESFQGVISKHYKKKNAHYIVADEFFPELFSYYDSSLENKALIKNTVAKPNMIKRKMWWYNCLEHVWDGLEIKFPHQREQIVFLMKRIIDMYLYDILTCQTDRHSGNWQIEEVNNQFDLMALFDNERILLNKLEVAETALGVEDEYEKLWKSIQRFLFISRREYKEMLYDKLWIIGESNLQSVFERIEKKTNYPMPEEKKVYYMESYSLHQKELKKILNNL